MAVVNVAADEVGVWEHALSAGTQDDVTFARALRSVRVTNVSGTAAVYFVVDSPADVTVGSGRAWWLPAIAGASRRVVVQAPYDGTPASVVKVKSVGTPTVSVEGEY